MNFKSGRIHRPGYGMIFRSFQLRIVIRVLILTLLIWAFNFTLSRQHWYAASFTSFVLIVVSVSELIRFLNRTNRDLGNFLLSIKHNDLSSHYSGRIPEKSFRGLQQAFNEVIGLFRQARTEREIQYRYLQNVIGHINTAVICMREDGRIELFNPSAQKMLGTGSLDSVEGVRQIDPGLFEIFTGIRPGESRLTRFNAGGEILQLYVFCTYFKLLDNGYKLISLQDIKNELEEQELESWQKLIRVLTHEIMNSLTPVSSLSTAVNEMLRHDDGRRKPPEDIPPDDLEDLYRSMDAIEERSLWLLDFLGSYKNLTRLPRPDFSDVPVISLLQESKQLMNEECTGKGIRFELDLPGGDLSVCADRKMIQQVIINLVSNAIEALSGQQDGFIELSAYAEDRHIFISVLDNGPGIDPEHADKIFIPFFTTKKKGSGIGLSLARQIMRAHKGSIRYRTGGRKGSVFLLEF